MNRPLAVFRVDASLAIGAGHVMRCLTLAEAMQRSGWRARFICREHPGNLIELIRDRGFSVSLLPMEQASYQSDGAITPAHPAWLGAPWQLDADQTLASLRGLTPDWLIVDHYALDAKWESLMRQHTQKILVIDDLADHPHVADMLLNQNIHASKADYKTLLPIECKLLTGTSYALLRPGFASLRGTSLTQKQRGKLEHIVISMGGVDSINATSSVLSTLNTYELPSIRKISIVLGQSSPWLSTMKALAAQLPVQNEVLVNVADMPTLLAGADLVIGAAGSSAWERCALGVPCIMVIVAENQRQSGYALHDYGAVALIDDVKKIPSQLNPILQKLIAAPNSLIEMSQRASEVCDGKGISRVMVEMRKNFEIGNHGK